MEPLNETPFKVAWLFGRLFFPEHSLSVIVKAAFDLHHDGAATPCSEQPLPGAAEPDPAAPAESAAVRYESDFAWFKPRADVLLVGTAHAPDGLPTDLLQVGLRVGRARHSVAVIGDRQWKKGLLGAKPTETTSFRSMPLGYARAYGGPGFAANPAGRGHRAAADESGNKLHPLPNLERLDDLVDAPGKEPQPAGFGPLAATWELRRRKLGTYGKSWQKERWPWFPEDFDWSHFNAAPPELQVEGYLRGDEDLELVNLHPQHAVYRSKLPGLRVRCFLDDDGALPPRLREVPMHLDTLWIDADAERAVLVWRGVAEVASDELDALRHLFVMQEPLAASPATPPTCTERFLAARAAEEAEWSAPAEPEPEPEAEDGAAAAAPAAGAPPPAADAGQDILSDIEIERLKRHARAAGVDPDHPPPLTLAQQATQGQILAALGLSRAEMLTAGIAAFSIPGQSPAEKAAVDALRKQLGWPEPEPQPEPAAEPSPSGEDGPWTRERVAARLAAGGSLAGLDLSGLDLAGLPLAGADLSGAILVSVSLRATALAGCNLGQANLTGADLSGADLTGASLAVADLTNAVLTGCQLVEADLANATLDGSKLQGAKLDRARGADASFRASDLSQATLVAAELPGADFTGAALEGAVCREAKLAEATFERARGARADFEGADLTSLRAAQASFPQASFRRARAGEAIFEAAELGAADFRGAILTRADLTKARAGQAIFAGCPMRGARFPRAVLAGARLAGADIMEGSFEKADLTRADLSGANLYGCEFLEAVTTDARLAGAILDATKLERRA